MYLQSQWLPAKKAKLRPSTYAGYRRNVKPTGAPSSIGGRCRRRAGRRWRGRRRVRIWLSSDSLSSARPNSKLLVDALTRSGRYRSREPGPGRRWTGYRLRAASARIAALGLTVRSTSMIPKAASGRKPRSHS